MMKSLKDKLKIANRKSHTASPYQHHWQALFDYDHQYDLDLSFRKGDIFTLVDGSDVDWLSVKHEKTGQDGRIPRSFVAPVGSVECNEWYFPCDRRECERLLRLTRNKRGSYLVRPASRPVTICNVIEGQLALSVKDIRQTADNRNEVIVRHLLIHRLDTGKYYVHDKKLFPDIQQLLDFYKCGKSPELKLGNVCVRDMQQSPLAEVEVTRTDIKLTTHLGSGNFGTVFAGIYAGKKSVAVKQVKDGAMSSEDFLAEALTMLQLRHSNIVSLLGVCTQSDGPILIITELMEKGSLLEYLRHDREALLGLRQVTLLHKIDMAAQVACGMSFLEQRKYIHRDLRAANVLIGQNNNVKVADFGLARLTYNDVYKSKGVEIAFKWTAIEALLNNNFSIKSDVWSYGVLLYEIITHGSRPYPEISSLRQLLPQLETGYRMPKPNEQMAPDCGQTYYDKMTECWLTSPASRPTFQHLHAFFTDYQTDDAVYEEIV